MRTKIVDMFHSDFYKEQFCTDKPHIYEYKIQVNGKNYYYIGSTIHSQYSRLQSNPYSEPINSLVVNLGKILFLEQHCVILEWIDDVKLLRKREAEINKQYKLQFGEEHILSKVDGNIPSKQCLIGAIQHQKENGSWNKGKQLSLEHKRAISNGGKKAQKLRYLREMLECITLYLDDNFTNTYRIQRYIKQHYDKAFSLDKEAIVPYIEIIKYDINILEKGNYG